jgi:predicted RND superfamily exporter protein
MGVEKENNELGQISMKHKISLIIGVIYLILFFLLLVFTVGCKSNENEVKEPAEEIVAVKELPKEIKIDVADESQKMWDKFERILVKERYKCMKEYEHYSHVHTKYERFTKCFQLYGKPKKRYIKRGIPTTYSMIYDFDAVEID